MNYKRIGLATALAAVVAGGAYAAVGTASASSVPEVRRAAPDIRRAVNPVPSSPYIVAPPGATLDSGDTDRIVVAGRTFSGTAVPSNATAVTVNVAALNPSAAGFLTVFTTGTTRPGGATLSYRRHRDASTTATVTLDSKGRLSVYSSERTQYTLRLLSYTTPDSTPPTQGSGSPSCTSTISTIAPSTRTITNVGGSIRTRATDFGSVTLPAGTYDARVIGGFTGATSNDTWYPNDAFLTGTLVLVKGADIAADFSNDVTAGGMVIPKSQSATLTQDPTLSISTFLVLAQSTDVHVKLFAYESNSGTAGSGQLQGNIQSAQFRKLC